MKYKVPEKKEVKVAKKVEPKEVTLNQTKDTTGDATELNYKSQIKE